MPHKLNFFAGGLCAVHRRRGRNSVFRFQNVGRFFKTASSIPGGPLLW
jgi:hypothetical protein